MLRESRSGAAHSGFPWITLAGKSWMEEFAEFRRREATMISGRAEIWQRRRSTS
jgi:hypothetical protein